MNDPRYPVGRYERRDVLTPDERAAMIEQIAAAPAKMREAVAGLTPQQLETPYREGGWTLRQVVHHVPDSHMNSYVRFKLALTETTPTIRPYDEARWAELADSVDTPPETSMTLLESLHDRWVRLLRSMSADDFQRTLNHPENGLMTLDAMLALYAWHGRHHVAHITTTRRRNGW
ncbi:MAG TPA: bacillithiol transferase BstA [Thermoanaerobaculia bacterium]|nr:bacillithiol transferase BstA [Thermoanaerobaculia bacterium]